MGSSKRENVRYRYGRVTRSDAVASTARLWFENAVADGEPAEQTD